MTSTSDMNSLTRKIQDLDRTLGNVVKVLETINKNIVTIGHVCEAIEERNASE